jgi:acylphosphatase
MIVCKHCFVSGRVQGVFFRVSTARRATDLKLTGYAKNLPDGRVEVLACGESASVDALCDWLWKGPPAAEVKTVEIQEVACTDIPEIFAVK